MNYNIAVCDDSAADRKYISDMVDEWAAGKGCDVRTMAFESAESFMFCYDDKKDYDILLLDIEMGGMDGVAMAKRLREQDDNVQIVFITGYSDYIAEGYEVAALHYLMKPVKKEKLFSLLDRAVEKLSKNEKMINMELGGELVRIPIYQIRYADVMGNYVTVHAAQDYTFKMTLGDLEAVKKYLDLLDEDLTTVDTVIKTGNPMTDAILNSKISLAKSKDINVVADAHIPLKLKTSEIDLCCIIGNLFDNAIDASMKLPKEQRVIRVYMDMKNTQLYISFTNFTAGKKLKKDGRLFHSTKGDGHGFGLVRIDAIVDRLDGYLSRNSEDGAFTTEILLPQI